MRSCLSIFALLSLCLVYETSNATDLRELPVQDGGRIKSFDSFARESLELIYGKQTFEGRPAHEIVMTWALLPEAWKDKKIFEVKNHEIIQRLSLDGRERYFTGDDLLKNGELARLVGDLEERRKNKEKLTPLYQDIQRIESQLIVFREIGAGRALRIMPGKDGDHWIGLAEFSQEDQNAFMPVVKNFVSYLGVVSVPGQELEAKNARALVGEAIDTYMSYVQGKHPSYQYGTSTKIEVLYNSLHPFRIAYLLYIFCAVTLIFQWITSKQHLMKLCWSLAGAGFLVHVLGFGMRMYLMGRAPVTNMYETVIWVAFGAMMFASVLEMIYRVRFYLLMGSIVSTMALVIADMAPAVLDPTLQPLEPVLRSNYWLTIHVMTITISYSAFFLAFGIGLFGLGYVIRGEDRYAEQVRALVMGSYRAIQVGVSFLAPGIILGGVWADYSWGRFWGWDPKETWALIVLLGYVALLHARLVGWVKHFGMLASAVLGFLLVIMAWYGVNFVLGAGLHSYGFGAGGVEYVAAFSVLCLAYVGFAFIRHSKSLGRSAHSAAK